MSDRVLRSVQFVQFGVLTAEEWEKYAIEITLPYSRGGAIENTPYDLRMGALDNGVKCLTCGEDNHNCPGHFGYIRLEEPMYNPEYRDVGLSILKCVCSACSAPRISYDMAETRGLLNLRRSNRLKAIKKSCESVQQCSACGTPLFTFFEKGGTIFSFLENKKSAIPLTAREALGIFSKIENDTLRMLGFNDGLSDNTPFTDSDVILASNREHPHQIRPEAFIFEILPMIPPCDRPWVIDGGERKDDDLTEKYNTILKLNNRLRDDREFGTSKSAVSRGSGKGKKKTEKLTEVKRKTATEDMHNHVLTLIDNSKEKAKASNGGRAHKGYRDRLGQKDGHIQTNAAGKRCDFSFRTVIVPGGHLLPMGWVGIPEEAAKILTKREMVTLWNIEFLSKLLEEKKIVRVMRQNFTVNVQQATNNFTRPFTYKNETGLRERDLVDRQLVDGDWGLLNRQPTLRIESMQGVQIKIFPGEYVMRLPLGMTRAFNADFDGDEIVEVGRVHF